MRLFSCEIMSYFPSRDPCARVSNGNRISSGPGKLTLVEPCILGESEAQFGKSIPKSRKICNSEN